MRCSLSCILAVGLIGCLALHAEPPVTPIPTSPSLPPAQVSPGVIPAAASARDPLPGNAFPVRLPPVGYQPVTGVPAVPQFQPASPVQLQPQLPRQEFAAAQVIATVGDEFILAGDLMPQVEMIIEMALQMVKPEDRQREAAKLRRQQNDLMQKILAQSIESKMLYVAFLQEIPEARREEAIPMIKKEMEKSFEESMNRILAKVRVASPSEVRSLMKQNAQLVRLAKIMTAEGLVSLGQLDLALRRYGTSLEQERRIFGERSLGRSVIGSNIDRDREVTHQQMLDYYQGHLQDYEIEAQVRWERLSVHFARIADKNAAYRTIAAMGNEVLRGAPFGAVAQRGSHGLRAAQGGSQDWTPQGSLKSEVVEKALYELPLNRLSPIIEDDRGFHIVRVLERREAGHVSFREAQAGIKKRIEAKNFNEQVATYIAKLRQEIKVWTIYERGPAGLAVPDPTSP